MVVKKNVETAVQKSAGTALAKPVFTRFDDEQLRQIVTVDDAMALAASTYGEIIDLRDLELGNGFKVTQDKRRLVGVPFLILCSQFYFGDFSEFASMMVFTLDGANNRIITNDGGAGVCQQLKQVIRLTGHNGGFTVPQGYRVSEYKCCPECGHPLPLENTDGPVMECATCGKDVGEKRQPGETFYFDLSEVAA